VVWSADYLRNVGTHTLLAIDVNHVGDVRFFNKTIAQKRDQRDFGCLWSCVGRRCPSLVAQASTAAISPTNPTNGADHRRLCQEKASISGSNVCGGGPCPTAAFAGQNPNLGVNQMLFPAGRSTYNAFEDLTAGLTCPSPFAGIKAMNWVVSYSLSRYNGSAQDSDFVNTAVDNNHPTAISRSPTVLIAPHQFSFGGTVDLPGSFRFGAVGHVYSPLAARHSSPRRRHRRHLPD